MKNSKTKLLIVAAAIIVGSNLSANAENSTNRESRAYFQIGGGPSLQQDFTVSGNFVPDGTKIKFKTGVRVDLAIGGENERWGVEFQTGTIYNAVKSINSTALNGTGLTLDMYQVPLMLNAYYHTPSYSRVRGYIGGGIGGVVSNFQTEGFLFDNSYEVSFGYQGMAGADIKLTESIDLDLGYRFLGTTGHDLGQGFKTDGTRNHSLLLSFRFKF